MGTMLQYGSAVSREFCKANLMTPKFAKLHDDGDIHIHDMDFMNMGTLKLCQKLYLIGRHGNVICGPVEKDVQAAPPLLRDVHEHHGNLTRPHGFGRDRHSEQSE